MTIAELHGKLGGLEYSEDLLTSDVFGTMRYAGWECGFLDWLAEAQCAAPGDTPAPLGGWLPGNPVAVDYAFWPTLPNRREPDVALLFQYANSPPRLIVVEAKYLSGMSDWEADAEAGEELTGDQLLDQVQGMDSMTPPELLAWFGLHSSDVPHLEELQRIHLLVTATPALPKYVYDQSQDRGKLTLPCYWLSWRTLDRHLSRHTDHANSGATLLVQDLRCLLSRKLLVPFRGFQQQPSTFPSSGSFFKTKPWWAQTPWRAPASVNPHFWRQTT